MNDVDSFMAIIDEINAKSPAELTPKDIDNLIAYHRRNRARKAAGEKPKKQTVDLSEVMDKIISKPKPSAPFNRRI